MDEAKHRGGQVGNLNSLKHGRFSRNRPAVDRKLDKRSALYKRIQARIKVLKKAD